MIDPWIGIVLVLATLGGLLAALGRTSRRRPELARKAAHVGMGLATLSFPWLFADDWPVLLLAAVTTLAFVALRAYGPQKLALGRTLHAVSRPSHGEIHFVLGTCAVFVLAAGNALLFCIPMLVLAFADAAAALVGLRYGRQRYAGGKTAEGSLACFAVASCCAFVPLALFVPVPVTELVATAALVAFAATAMEAAGPRGLDNLLVPLGAFFALDASGIIARLPTPARCDPAVAIALAAAIVLPALLAFLHFLRISRAHSRWGVPR